MGYNVDRDSSEFAVADVRKALRAIGETEGFAASILLLIAGAPTSSLPPFSSSASKPTYRALPSPNSSR